MKLTHENIGIIKNATVQVNGLTVIAGENDTVKESTFIQTPLVWNLVDLNQR
ncbi:MAG: hypothetical protein VSS75_009940 [Candidatus Parabeggiatoa sp.]|nr:hypothetical protein [Candidatus Parabeggiatoa sp.]